MTARRTFGKPLTAEEARPSPSIVPSTSPSSTPAATPKGKRDWPLPVRTYVQRCFAEENILPDVKLQEMEVKLKQVISKAVETGTLAVVDWDNLPLPQMMIREEHAQAHCARLSSSPIQSSAFPTTTLHGANESKSKKRKSSETGPVDDASGRAPPWSQTNSRNTFESRISYPEKRPRNEVAQESGSSKSFQILDGRKKRFEPTAPGTSPVRPWRTSTAQEAPPQEREGPIVGRCQELEKKYFRLTSAPNPDTVRPLPILEKTLDHLKRRWKQERNYSYICDQFKSLRQDLTVQRIKNGFTVNAYEIHARIALEKGDLSEYNQCQTQLRALYAQKLGGHPAEFMAYRILYFLHTSNRIDMNDVLADLTPTEKQDRAVKHALETRSALALGNYHRFFELYLDTPNMGAYLMDMFVARERLAALSAICRA